MSDIARLIKCSFETQARLYTAYMPFVTGGGLFIRTDSNYFLDEPLRLSIHLMNETQPYLISGKVIWITPQGAQGNKPAGIGLQFISENSQLLANKIEAYLAEMLKSTQLTDTM